MYLQNKQVDIQNWGLTGYQVAFEQQEALLKTIMAIKVANRQQEQTKPTPNYLVFCEHPHVYTLGKSGNHKHLLANKKILQEKQATFFNTNRGGDITYHGPGQLVVYPILDLENFFTDIYRYLRLLEEVVIATLQDFGLHSGRIPGLTGVWIAPQAQEKARKICAIGVRISRWITMHGLAFNVTTDLSYFDYIIPCGIPASKVTSLAQELGWEPSIDLVADKLQAHMVRLLAMEPLDLCLLDR